MLGFICVSLLVAMVAADGFGNGQMFRTCQYFDIPASDYKIKVNSISVSPNPITVTENAVVDVSASVEVNQAYTDYKIQRVVNVANILELPCIGVRGSCPYDKVCESLDGSSAFLQNIQQTIGSCPVASGTYNFAWQQPVPVDSFTLQTLKGLGVSGQASVIIRNEIYGYTDAAKTTMQPAACYEVKMTFQIPA